MTLFTSKAVDGTEKKSCFKTRRRDLKIKSAMLKIENNEKSFFLLLRPPPETPKKNVETANAQSASLV